MNKKKQELTDLTSTLENKLLVLGFIRKVIKFSYTTFSISAITTMLISIIFKISSIYSLAFWLLFSVFVLFFVEKYINNTEPDLKKNISYLKIYAAELDLETTKTNPIKNKK